jgi:hypothetical protein
LITGYFVIDISLILLFLGCVESFAAGWMSNWEDQVEMFGAHTVLIYMVANYGTILVACSVWFGLDAGNDPHAHRMWLGFFGGLVVFLVGFAGTIVSLKYAYLQRYCTRQQGGATTTAPFMTPRQYYVEFVLGNVLSLKRSLEPTVGSIPESWCMLIKSVVPHLLLMVLMKHIMVVDDNAQSSPNNNRLGGFGDYGNYPFRPYQLAGILLVVLMAGMFLLGCVAPQVYGPILPPPTTQFINRRDTMEDDLNDDTEDITNSTRDPLSLDESIVIQELAHMEEPVVALDADDGEEETTHGDRR